MASLAATASGRDSLVLHAGHLVRADLRAWIAVVAGAIGAFMATLDIAIVNTSLPAILGSLGANLREGSWIATAFLVAEVIVIPLCGWLERVLGIRTLLLVCVTMFTASSILCGAAETIAQMIVGRVGQGFFGGALIPTALIIVARQLPAHQQPIGTAIFGGAVLCGPIIGPVLGGWIADEIGWRYIFYINLPVGIFLSALVVLGLSKRSLDLGALHEADWCGIAGLALGLGCLTALLEQGQMEEWFDSLLITRLAIFSALGFALVAVGQVRARRPVVNLGILRNHQFAAVFVISFVMGAGLYGTAFVIPQFLSQIAGDSAMQAGLVVLIAGIPAIILVPFIPLLLRNVDMRVGVAIGLAFMAATCWIDSQLTSGAGDANFVLSQLARGVGQVLAMTFLNQAALSSVSTSLAADASGLFNAARNMGGSFGLASLSILHEQRFDLHNSNISSAFDGFEPFENWVSSSVDPGALISATQASVTRESLLLVFNDQFLALTLLTLATIPLALMLRTRISPRDSRV